MNEKARTRNPNDYLKATIFKQHSDITSGISDWFLLQGNSV